ncbi:MAG TPA: hypothetical protein VM677_34140 [Actinokineospora sp.]|nr:hypothetical protein [Actinokineospora sp.]
MRVSSRKSTFTRTVLGTAAASAAPVAKGREHDWDREARGVAGRRDQAGAAGLALVEQDGPGRARGLRVERLDAEPAGPALYQRDAAHREAREVGRVAATGVGVRHGTRRQHDVDRYQRADGLADERRDEAVAVEVPVVRVGDDRRGELLELGVLLEVRELERLDGRRVPGGGQTVDHIVD